jgi:uncharacterized protein (UPF0261 family)
MAHKPHIVVAGILDTKGHEIKYLAARVTAAGGEPAIRELTVGGEVGWADIPVSRGAVAPGIPTAGSPRPGTGIPRPAAPGFPAGR